MGQHFLALLLVMGSMGGFAVGTELTFQQYQPIVIEYGEIENTDSVQTTVDYDVDKSNFAFELSDNQDKMYAWAPPGVYKLIRTVERIEIDWDKQKLSRVKTKETFDIKVLGDSKPVPDPKPEPEPKPDDTAKEPSVNPTGLTVMIVYNAEDSSLPEKTISMLYDSKVTGYMDSKCLLGPDRVPSWRIWDNSYTDSQIVGSPEYIRRAYKKALEKADGKFPLLFISTPKESVWYNIAGMTASQVLELLKKHGG